MAFRFGDSSDDLGDMAEINVTPLVDVMLVLLIIFMVTAPLMMVKLPIELPKTSAEEVGKPLWEARTEVATMANKVDISTMRPTTIPPTTKSATRSCARASCTRRTTR